MLNRCTALVLEPETPACLATLRCIQGYLAHKKQRLPP